MKNIEQDINLEVLRLMAEEQQEQVEDSLLSPTHDFKIGDEDDEKVNENWRLLENCRDYYDSLRDFRDRFFRAYRYYRGQQWSDTIENSDGETVTEEEYILNKGKLPFIQNVLRQQGRSLIGLFRQNQSKPTVVTRKEDKDGTGDMLTNALQSVHYLNRTRKLDARNFEMAMLSGAAAYKQSYQFWPERNTEDVYMEPINPVRIGFNTDIEDPRLSDLRLIFEIIDAPADEVVSTFARDKKEAKKIREWYDYVNKDTVNQEGLDKSKLENMDFYIPLDDNRYRVFEVWEKKSEWRLYIHDPADGTSGVTDYSEEDIQAENEKRKEMSVRNGVPIPFIKFNWMYYQFWYVKYLTPYGHTLYEGESFYEHGEHPYTMFLYPMVNGEVWGMIEDVIDQQRYINRLISLMDFIMGSSAKGVLMVPEDSIPDDMSLDDVADEWSKFDGVIKIKTKPGQEKNIPQQIVSRSANIGAEEMLSLQMKLVEQIFGTSGAMQGHETKSGTPSSLYLQQAENSTINSRDFMEEYSDFLKSRDRKAVKLIQQFYNEQRFIAVGGKTFHSDNQFYDPEKGAGTDFDIVVTYGMDSPVYKQYLEDFLMQMLNNQHISIEMFLEHSSLPFADSLLKTISSYKQQQGMAGMTPEMQEQLSQQIQQGGQQVPQGNQNEVQKAMDMMQMNRSIN